MNNDTIVNTEAFFSPISKKIGKKIDSIELIPTKFGDGAYLCGVRKTSKGTIQVLLKRAKKMQAQGGFTVDVADTFGVWLPADILDAPKLATALSHLLDEFMPMQDYVVIDMDCKGDKEGEGDVYTVNVFENSRTAVQSVIAARKRYLKVVSHTKRYTSAARQKTTEEIELELASSAAMSD